MKSKMENEKQVVDLKKSYIDKTSIQSAAYKNYKSVNNISSVYRDHFQKTAKEIIFPIIHEDALRFLQFWVSVSKPKEILELGTGFGFLASHLLMTKSDLKITGVDYTAENLKIFESIVEDDSIRDRYHFIEANVIYWIQQIETQFDWVILDVDKKFYPLLADHIFRLVKPGGYIIADNVLWKGMVAEENLKSRVEPILKWNEMLKANHSFESVIIPIGDGLAIGKKS